MTISDVLYKKLLSSPPGFLATKEGKALIRRCITHIRLMQGEKASKEFMNKITALEITEKKS